MHLQVKVLSCKFLNDQGYGYVSDAVACIDYCLSMGVDIITNSWAGGEDNPAMKDVIQKASSQGIYGSILLFQTYICDFVNIFLTQACFLSWPLVTLQQT